MASGVGRSIPEIRGMAPTPRDRTTKYSANSYAAQYGITVDDAEEMLERCDTHQQVERMIFASYKADPELKRRALVLDETIVLTEEEKRFESRAKEHLGDKDSA